MAAKLLVECLLIIRTGLLGPCQRDAQQIIDQCHWLESLGVTETIVSLPPLQDFEAYLDRLRWVAEEVMCKWPAAHPDNAAADVFRTPTAAE